MCLALNINMELLATSTIIVCTITNGHLSHLVYCAHFIDLCLFSVLAVSNSIVLIHSIHRKYQKHYARQLRVRGLFWNFQNSPPEKKRHRILSTLYFEKSFRVVFSSVVSKILNEWSIKNINHRINRINRINRRINQ